MKMKPGSAQDARPFPLHIVGGVCHTDTDTFQRLLVSVNYGCCQDGDALNNNWNGMKRPMMSMRKRKYINFTLNTRLTGSLAPEHAWLRNCCHLHAPCHSHACPCGG